MGMKFLNKKGWHTGSLRNIETVWKAEQKQEAEEKKLEELRLQLSQERERNEFRALQEQAGLVPRQERLEFLYESGLAVGKGSSSGHGVSFQKEEQPLAKAEAGNSATEKADPSAPGALFEEKAQSANDSWRKLHSDPLLLIKQREQDALANIKNNPVKMALIRKSVEKKGKGKDGDRKEHKKKYKRKSGKHHKQSSSRYSSESEEDSDEENNGRKSHYKKTSGKSHDKHYERPRSDLEDESEGKESRDRHYGRRRSELDDELKRRESKDNHYERRRSYLDDDESKRRVSHDKHNERRRSDLDDESKRRVSHDKHNERRRSDLDDESKRRESHDKRRRSGLDDEAKGRESHREIRANEKYRNHSPKGSLERENIKSYGQEDKKRKIEDRDNGKRPSKENEYQNRRRKGGSKLSEEERAARLKQMQMDAEVHEEQRWRRIKKADETDAVEADKNKVSTGKSFLDDANKSVYGIEKGGSSTIEESVRRRSYYSQRGTEAEGIAFRR